MHRMTKSRIKDRLWKFYRGSAERDGSLSSDDLVTRSLRMTTRELQGTTNKLEACATACPSHLAKH